MISVSAVAAVILGVVFLTAGVSKFVARERWPDQAAALGVRRGLAMAVPPLEIGLGALLVAQIARGAVAIVAAVVLVVFTGLILMRITEGHRPPCACFGAWSATPLGAVHIVRNLALIVIAAVAALG